MAKVAQDEIDTIFETKEGVTANDPAEHVKSIAADIMRSSEIDSLKEEEAAAAEAAPLPEKTFYFSDFPRQVYCTLSGIRVRLIQTGEGIGIAYLTFTQSCNSRRSDVASGPDWTFEVKLYDVQNAFIRTVQLGSWNHRCGKQLVELRADFIWVPGSINPVRNAVRANLNWRFLQRVHNCG